MKYKLLTLIFMFSIFSSCKSQNRDLPEWANFFNKKEYNHFINLVEKYFEKKNLKMQINDGVVITEKNDLGLNNLGLVNLAQNCKQDEQQNWPALINDHFEAMIQSSKFDLEFIEIINDFEKIEHYLGVRVFHLDYIESIGKENVIYKTITDDMIELLVFDLPYSVRNVKPQDVTKWKKQYSELFDIGLKNITSKYKLEISEQKLGDFKIWFIQSDHIFASNIILDKEELSKYIGSKGALISVPHRHAVLIYPIENLEVVKAINTLIPITKGMNSEGPGSISEKLFWYNGIKLIELPYEILEKELNFSPPAEFLDMLNTLK